MKLRIAVLVVVVCSLSLHARAADRLKELAEMLRAGRAAEARAQLKVAAETYRSEGDTQREGVALMLLGLASAGLREEQAALSDSFEEGRRKLTASGDHYAAWLVSHFAAAVEIGKGDWERAIERQRTALAMLDEAAKAEKFSLDAVVALGPVFGMDLGPSGSMVAAAPAMFKSHFLQLAEMMSRDSLGNAYTELGELEKAEAELERAGELSAPFMGTFDISLAAHLGDLRTRQWKLDEALVCYRRALDAMKSLPPFLLSSPLLELPVLGKLANTELLRGDIAAALSWNDRAQQLVAPLKQPSRDASVLKDRAFLLMQASRYGDALQTLERALELAKTSGNIEQQASIVTEIGTLQFYRGDYGAAPATLERAIELYQKVKDPLGESHAWVILTQVYITAGARDKAASAVVRAREAAKKSGYAPWSEMVEATAAALSMLETGPTPELMERVGKVVSHPDMGDTLLNGPLQELLQDCIAVTTGGERSTANPLRPRTHPMFSDMRALLDVVETMRRGETASARELLKRNLESAPSNELRFGYLALLAASYTREGNHAEASRWYHEVVEALEQPALQMADDELMTAYFGTGRRWLFDFAIEGFLREGKAAEAFDYAERARARAFLRVIGNHRIAPGQGGNERLVREAEALRKQIAEWEASAGSGAAPLTAARQEYRALMGRLRTTNPEYASLTRVEPLLVEDIRRELPPGTTLVSYFTTVQGLHAWILDAGTLTHVSLTTDHKALARAACWAARFGNRNARGATPRPLQCSESATAEEVHDMLVAPLRAKLRNARLIIVPHGVLHYVPFAALRDRTTGRYFIEDYTFTLTPSASALRFLRQKETPVRGGALVLGNPDNRAGALPGAEREAVTVARSLGTVPLTGSAAAESLLYRLQGDVDLLHISAHGLYDTVTPTFSRLALAAGEGHDGNLEVHEILSDLDLTGVNLVVLSACQTAVGERSGGDDVTGLTRALLYAGSPGVISTLWDIDDEAAAELMEELYCRLVTGASAADALRAAQLALLRSGDYADPQHWAAFALTGNPAGRWNSTEK